MYIFISVILNGQQLPYFGTEIYSPHWHNPASFGTWNTFSVNSSGIHSKSFGYYNYASGSISGEGFIGIGKKSSGIGIGGTYIYDQGYFEQSHSASIKFNYQFAFEKVNLSVGMAPGFRTIRVPDPNLPQAGMQTKPIFDAGMYLYTDKFYAGFSVNQMNDPFYDELSYQEAANYFFNAGYRFKVSKNIRLFPTVIVASDATATSFSSTFLVEFMKPSMSLGLGYGMKRNVRGVVGYEFKGMSFLYSFGTNSSMLTNATNFQQEIRLSYRLKK